MWQATRSARATAKEETREALLLAGLAEFAEHGLDAPSLDAICARAGFTRGAFYVHFRDREDFLVAAMERVLGPFLDAVIGGGDAPQDLAATVRRFVETLGAIGTLGAEAPPQGAAAPAGLVQFHRLLEACTRSPRLRERLVGLLGEAMDRVAQAAQAGQRRGSVRRDVEPAAVAALLVPLALGVITAEELGVALDLAAAKRALLTLIGVGS